MSNRAAVSNPFHGAGRLGCRPSPKVIAMIIPDAPWSADDTGWATQICDRLGERRSRLFVSACCRGYCKEPVPAEVAEALETYDRYADTGKTKAALRESKDRIAPHTKHTKFAYLIGNMFNTDVMPRSYRRQFGDVYNVLEAALSADFDVRLLPRLGLGAECNLKLNRVDAIAHLERVLVEIGYPEPPIGQLDPRWRTADVLGLARAVYADRAFDRMPFLADALLDAGCDAQAIIDHCRTAGAHQRGCWVLDLILAGQWKEIWEKPKSDGGKSKASRSPFGLTDANKRHLKRSMAVEARDGMEDRLTWVYEYQLPGRAERARDAHARNELKNRSVEQYLEREAYVCAFGREYWLDRGRVRRIASNDPGELARHASLACRATWIHDYTEYGWTPPEIIAESLLHAIAVRDTLVEQRFL
ncbi:MAG TPA: hypothetical protein VKD90_20405, partial [Gemmataceae bacterium]|nr:hypothetical protein [Gemmataceae bacterium]